MTVRPSAPRPDWPTLRAHAGRPWLRAHRGALPVPRAATTAPDAPIAIAVCAQFGERPGFATERDGETWRWVGPRALNVCNLWTALRYDREDVRISIGIVRYWQACGETRQAERGRAELEQRWKAYRRRMHSLAAQLAWVRHELAPRPATAAPATMPAVLAAE